MTSYESITFNGTTEATTVYLVEDDSSDNVIAIFASETVTTETFVNGGSVVSGAGNSRT